MPDPITPELSIPWKVIAASPDMLDVTYNNRRYPYIWRSSLALSVFEPSENLPSGLCDQKLAFIKLTCSITGYQPAEGEGEGAQITFPNLPQEELERVFTEYWGCYGVLVNIGVFPLGARPPNFRDYPHIVDFLPKNRELVRPVTATGEVLTASTASLRLDSGLTTTQKNETQVGIKGGYAAGDQGGWNVEGNIEHTWGSSTEAKSETEVAGGTQRQFTSGYSTSVDHLYSLLTGYHAGTNRAAFIMLPRPFMEEPTDRHTFVRGLRAIEGVQEFVLVVSRPVTMPGLCIEASLDTAHLPEQVSYDRVPTQYETRDARFTTTVFAPGSVFAGIGTQTVRLEDSPSAIFRTPDGWLIDRFTAGGGVEEVANRSSVTANTNLQEYNFGAVDNRTARVTGRLRGRDWGGDPESVFMRDYVVHIRSEVETNSATAHVSTSMLTTSRHLSACYESRDGCPQPPQLPLGASADVLHVREDLFDSAIIGGLPGDLYRTIMARIKTNLVANASDRPTRPPALRFTETDYFKEQVLKTLSQNQKNVPLSAIESMPEKFAHLSQLTIQGVLDKRLATLCSELRLSAEEAVELRQSIIKHVGGVQE
jgi:hypothetical protein